LVRYIHNAEFQFVVVEEQLFDGSHVFDLPVDSAVMGRIAVPKIKIHLVELQGFCLDEVSHHSKPQILLNRHSPHKIFTNRQKNPPFELLVPLSIKIGNHPEKKLFR
jgi:hypothetical protein